MTGGQRVNVQQNLTFNIVHDTVGKFVIYQDIFPPRFPECIRTLCVMLRTATQLFYLLTHLLTTHDLTAGHWQICIIKFEGTAPLDMEYKTGAISYLILYSFSAVVQAQPLTSC